MQLDKAIEEAAKRISFSEEKSRSLASSLAFLRSGALPKESGFLEEKPFFPVRKAELNCKIAGIDSGFMAKELSSVDLILVRAIAAVFTYKNNRLAKAEYNPSPASLPEPFVISSGTELDDLGVSVSLLRLKEEISKSIEAIEKFSPNYCFLDGSIVPQYPDKPRQQQSELHRNYLETISIFENLYSTAEKNSCVLVACVEDSRGTRFRDIVSQLPETKAKGISLAGTNDSMLLLHLLSLGERTSAFAYSADTKKHPILADFSPEWAKKVNAFYIKPSALDNPLRVEFLSSQSEARKSVEQIAPIVCSLSSLHKEYAFPSILIEADLRARLRHEEIGMILDRVFDKAGKNGIIAKRRDRRPFR